MIYDAVIVGSGMVGATLAARLNLPRIALIDAEPFSTREDPRLIALTYPSFMFLNELGLSLENEATPIHTVHVSHRGKFGTTRIHHHDINLPALGFLIAAKHINAALHKKLQTLTHIDIIRPATLKNLVDENNVVTLTLEKENTTQTLATKKVIGADGTHSTVRTLANIATEKFDYQQSAIVTITQLQRDHHHVAYERFLEKGALAMLPMPNQCVATIWTDDNKKITELMALDDNRFLETLQKNFGYRLGRLQHISRRYTFPLHGIVAKENQKQNITLIGNAAHTIHPVGAQGFNLALQEVAQFVKNPFQAFTANSTSLQLSKRLNSLFAMDFFPVNLARALGMIGFDLSSQVKNYFLRKTFSKKDFYDHRETT